jgi:D-glycero-D-manno-heptose 1,7-bisphosphate phosphatase
MPEPRRKNLEPPPAAIFLDRDGVINRKRPEDDYVKAWEEFEFLPGALEAVRLLSRVAQRLIIVTNQRGIALGRMDEQSLHQIHSRMLAAIRQAGGRIDAVYYCPHHSDACECRKPGIGLYQQAKREFPEIAFANALVVGDSIRDLEAASRLGCQAVLLAEGERRAGLLEEARRRSLPVSQVASSLLEFSRQLLERLG